MRICALPVAEPSHQEESVTLSDTGCYLACLTALESFFKYLQQLLFLHGHFRIKHVKKAFHHFPMVPEEQVKQREVENWFHRSSAGAPINLHSATDSSCLHRMLHGYSKYLHKHPLSTQCEF